jgi:hypothetical protein
MGFDAGDSNVYRYANNNLAGTKDASGLHPPLPQISRKALIIAWNEAAGANQNQRGKEKILGGTLEWNVSIPFLDQPLMTARFEYKPDSDNKSTVISFVQVVQEQTWDGSVRLGGGTNEDNKWLTDHLVVHEPRRNRKGLMVDIAAGENDMYYGAAWSKKSMTWVSERNAGTPGYGRLDAFSPLGKGLTRREKANEQKNAMMDDRVVSTVQGKQSYQFETAVIAIDTQEVLGVIEWGFKNTDFGFGDTTRYLASKVVVRASAPTDELKIAVAKGNLAPTMENKITGPIKGKMLFGGFSAVPD